MKISDESVDENVAWICSGVGQRCIWTVPSCQLQGLASPVQCMVHVCYCYWYLNCAPVHLFRGRTDGTDKYLLLQVVRTSERNRHADRLCNFQQNKYSATARWSAADFLCSVLLFRCSKECAKTVSAHPFSSQSDRGQRKQCRLGDKLRCS